MSRFPWPPLDLAFSLRPGRRPRRRLPPAAAEWLEDRTLLTSYVVDTLEDVVAADGKISLREAILAANTNVAVGDAPAGAPGSASGAITLDVINFADGLAGTIRLTGGHLDVADRLSIGGPGASRLTVSGDSASRVFAVARFAVVFIDSLTIAGGRVADGDGGGVLNLGSLFLFGCTVSGNEAASFGGGVHNAGELTLNNCAVSGNSGYFSGGGISTFGPQSRLQVFRTTVTGNSTLGSGGGIYGDGTLSAANTTVSGNSAAVSGGGMHIGAEGSATLRNVTAVNNVADSDADGSGFGGGIGIAGGGAGSVALHNTLVAGNSRTVSLRPFQLSAADDVRGTPAAGSSHNLVSDAGTAGGLVHGAIGNVVGVDWRVVYDPVLRDHGATNLTHKLLVGSPAIDAGSNAETGGAPTDQRGFPRLRGARVDVGAFESAPAADLAGFVGRSWYVGASTGTSFVTVEWARWATPTWDALRHGDFDGDGRADVLGLLAGEWYVGKSTGTSFLTARWGRWATVAWDHVLVGDLNRDGRDDVIAEVGGVWYGGLSTGTAFAAPVRLARTADADWGFAALGDVTGDRRADLVLMLDGVWSVAVHNGATFYPTAEWARWKNADYRFLGLANFGGTYGLALVGFIAGEWYVGHSNGRSFGTVLRAKWANAAWADPVVADFDGNGLPDVGARLGREWWVGTSTFHGAEAARSRWTLWADVAWGDVRTGDFDGDGRDDVAGRYSGEWYVGRSLGRAFVTGFWGRWAETAWQAVAARDATGHRLAVGAFEASATSAPAPASAAATAFQVADDEPLAAFWKAADEDEEFAGLLAAV